MLRIRLRRIALSLLAVAMGLTFASAALAETNKAWVGGTSIVWGTAGNWSASGAPTSVQNAQFSGSFTGANQPQVQSAQSSTIINGIWMTGTPGKAVTITRNATTTNGLTITPTDTINGISGLGILVDNSDGFALNLSLPIALGAAQEWRNTTNITVNVSNANSIISGAGNLTLRGTGGDLASAFRVDNRAETFTGQLTIAQGVYRTTQANNVSANGPLGNSAAAVILGDTADKLGILRVGAASSATTKPFTLANGGRGGFWVDHDTTTPTLTLNGKVSGGGKLVKLGARDDGSATTLELGNSNNDWTGGALVTDGYVSIAAGNRLGDGTVTLDYDPQYITNSGQGHSGLVGMKFTGDTTLTAPTKSIVINAGVGSVGGILDVAAATTTTLAGNGALSGSGNLNKAATGTLAITGNNSYAGATMVSAGTLLVNGAHTGGGAYTVNSGATLGGTGSTASAVTVNGTLAPGSSIESLAVGNLTFGSTSTFAYELNTTALNGDLVVAGALNINNATTLGLTDVNPGTANPGDKLTLINYTGDSWDGGTFTYSSNPLPDGGTFTLGANTWQIDYNDTTGGSNFTGDYSGSGFVTITVVPEPSNMLMILVGWIALVFARSRRHKALVS